MSDVQKLDAAYIGGLTALEMAKQAGHAQIAAMLN